MYATVNVVNVEGTQSIPMYDRVEYAEMKQMDQPVRPDTCSNILHDHDQVHTGECNLDNLLIQLSSQVTPKWYQFGLVAGIAKMTLDRYPSYSPKECLVEVLDYWLRNNPHTPTWRDVAEVLKEIELSQLADDILKVYKTGK